MSAEEQPGPNGVHCQLQDEESQGKDGALETELSPQKPRRERHEQVENCPNGRKEPIGRIPGRFVDTAIPVVGQKSGTYPSRKEDQEEPSDRTEDVCATLRCPSFDA